MEKLPKELISKIKLYVGNPMITYNKNSGSNICNQAMKITMGLNKKKIKETDSFTYSNIGKWFYFWMNNINENNFSLFITNEYSS